MKTIALGIGLIVFLISYNLYLEVESSMCLPIRVFKLWNYYSLFFLLFILFISERFKGDYFQYQFTIIGWIVLFITIFIILLNNHGLVKNPYDLLKILDCGTFMATLMILISGSRHGAFKD